MALHHKKDSGRQLRRLSRVDVQTADSKVYRTQTSVQDKT